MHKYSLFVAAVLLSAAAAHAVYPTVDNSDVVDDTVLMWPSDINDTSYHWKQSLTEPTSNLLNDFHGTIAAGACDLVLSTAGNYHMALRELWANMMAEKPWIRTHYYTTSPPILPQQVGADGSKVVFGNMQALCPPMIGVGPKGLMNSIEAAGIHAVGATRKPIIQNQGNVILVPAGNPLGISSVFDLAAPGIRYASSNKDTEGGSFGNYRDSVYNIALQASNESVAEATFDAVYNDGDFITGKRIHHREVPYLIATGQADAGLIFYHLAKYMVDTFPTVFEIVPLGGTVAEPVPMAGNKVGKLFLMELAAPTGTEWSRAQRCAANGLVKAMTSSLFTDILASKGILRPAGSPVDVEATSFPCTAAELAALEAGEYEDASDDDDDEHHDQPIDLGVVPVGVLSFVGGSVVALIGAAAAVALVLQTRELVPKAGTASSGHRELGDKP